MSATAQLAQQLAQLSDSLKTTNNLISQLSKLSFQPGSEPLETDQGTVRVELSQDIHDSLKQLEEDLELLKQEAEDLNAGAGTRRKDSDKDREKARISAQVARLVEDLKGSRSHFRRAQLTAKKASEAAKQKERELVFASLQNPPQSDLPNGTADGTNPQQPDLFAGRRALAQKSKLTKEELEVDAASTVTASLRRTHDLLSTELSRSRFAQETFDQSTAALEELGEHYSNLDTILSNSRNLLGTLLRSQKSDTWYLETAFYILIATLVWLIFRRILLGPFIRLPLFLLRWFVWKPFLLFLSVTGILTADPAAAGATDVAGPRTPLIVKNSAKGSATPIGSMGDQQRRGVPVGAGGAGAKMQPAPEMVEKIGKMAEESAKGNQAGGEKEAERRADGTVLEERGEVKRNPKKKMFEADVEDAKQAEREGEGEGRKRDEL